MSGMLPEALATRKVFFAAGRTYNSQRRFNRNNSTGRDDERERKGTRTRRCIVHALYPKITPDIEKRGEMAFPSTIDMSIEAFVLAAVSLLHCSAENTLLAAGRDLITAREINLITL